ncbi:hypothetical protein [Sphaerisporangium flaviroseum]|uniref:hypothetical protein n=1 Tax=Sphaerisporangium flaviroseum TaxID=509199 RepID=UPI0031E69C38
MDTVAAGEMGPSVGQDDRARDTSEEAMVVSGTRTLELRTRSPFLGFSVDGWADDSRISLYSGGQHAGSPFLASWRIRMCPSCAFLLGNEAHTN